MGKKSKLTQKGFTLIELLIATSVFSFILLLCASALIQISRQYQKGVIRAQTQETARSIIVNLAESIQFGGGDVYPAVTVNGTYGYCIDNKLISFLPNWKLVDGARNMLAQETNHAMVVSQAGGCSQTTQAQNLMVGGPGISGDELLAPNMRVMGLTICKPGECGLPANSQLYRITLKIGYGDRELFSSGNCIGSRFGGSFCATSELATTVQKRIVD